jgi:hypothetical protein
VDLAAPPFSNPTEITNPLFPIGEMPSAILSGKVDGRDFKAETTVLKETRIIEWRGGQIEALVSQYVAYLDGCIQEVALDFYAQADDGSVWYVGEDVFNYEDGFIGDTEGTWLAGREGPPAMIMPAKPRVGDVYRPENVPGLVFEEVKVKAVDRTVRGPHGRSTGRSSPASSTRTEPGRTRSSPPATASSTPPPVGTMSVAVPAERLPGPVPAELERLSAGADTVFRQARTADWRAASATVRKMSADWRAFQRGAVPPRLDARMSRALDGLVATVDRQDGSRAPQEAIRVAQAGLDLELRHRPPTEIDRERFSLWARQLVLDGAAGDAGSVRGDLATLEWIRDRFLHTLDKVGATRVDAHLVELRTMVSDGDLSGAATEAARLVDTVAEAGSARRSVSGAGA